MGLEDFSRGEVMKVIGYIIGYPIVVLIYLGLFGAFLAVVGYGLNYLWSLI